MQTIITRALVFLAKAQSSDGSFESAAFFSAAEKPIARHTTFHTALITLALSPLPHSKNKNRITTGGTSFLLREKSPQWSFNYWKKSSPEHAAIRCPDDLDDTTIALAAITLTDRTIITEGAMVAILQNFLLTESVPGGPYNTWILPEYKSTRWEDIDITVNSNCAYFLSLHEITLSPLVDYIEQRILQHDYSSMYYHPIATIYSITRWYRGPLMKNLLDRLLSERLDILENVPYIAMALASLLRLGGPKKIIDVLTKKLLLSQHTDGSWDAGETYIEQIANGEPLYSGSAALSTALSVEALYLAKSNKSMARRDKSHCTAEAIGTHAKQRFITCGSMLLDAATASIDRLIAKDTTNEVALLARQFAHATQYLVTRSLWTNLGTINILGWVGYTIVDSVLDGEDAITQLPLAAICIREVSTSFQTLVPTHYHQEIREILDQIESAHAWEHASCKIATTKQGFRIPAKLPFYGDLRVLAQKSIGHALGPMTIIYLYEKKHTKAYAALVQSFFEHYLIARQLNDDAHDWEEDLKNGFLNSVSVQILKQLRRKVAVDEIVMERDRETLCKTFWDVCITQVSAQIHRHTNRARALLSQMPFITDPAPLIALLTPLEHAAQKALDARASAVRFLAAYAERDSTIPTNDSSAR